MPYALYLFVFCTVSYALAYAYQQYQVREQIKHELALAEAQKVSKSIKLAPTRRSNL